MYRNGALDILKIVLALMVVGMHAGFLTDISDVVAHLTLNGLFRIAVPIFLQINGYFFYQVALAGAAFKWVKRVLILYLVWMAVYLPYWLPDSPQNITSLALKSAHTILFGHYHLWYLAGMLGAALMMIAMARASTKQLIVAVIATFLGGVIIQYVGSYQLLGSTYLSKIFSLSWPHRNFMFFSFPFFCAGYLMNKHKIQNSLSTRTTVALASAGAAAMFAESYLNFIGTSSGAAVDNLISLAVVCPAIFVLFIKLNVKTNSRELALYSTGIYLVHVLIISKIQQIVMISPTALTVLTAISATAVSAVLILVDRKLRFIL